MKLNYKKYDLESSNLHVIKTDKFKTVAVRIYFKRKLKKDEINYRNMLSDILLESNSQYKTRRQLQIQKEELYNISLSGSSYKSGEYTFITYSMSFLNEKYTEPNMNEKSIELLLDLIQKPYIDDNKFDLETFNYTKDGLKNFLVSIDENPDRLAAIRLEEEMGENTPLAYRASGYLDTLDEVTSEKLYEYYKSMIENDIIDIFVIGDIDEEKIKQIFEKRKFRDKKNPKTESHFVKLEDTRKEKEIIENKGFVQSKLKMGFKMSELDDFERKYVMIAYNFILGGGNDSKLFREVREKNSLCYYISSSYSNLYQMLTVSAGIANDSYEKTVSLVKKAIQEMKDGDFDDDDLEEVKSIYKNTCLSFYDNPFDIINSYLVHEYLDYDLIEDKIKNIQKVTKEDIIKVASKIKLDTVYFLEGGSDE